MKNYEIPRCFFHFFEILIIWVVRVEGGIKGEKMVQNEKKFCLSCSISQELYIIWFSFMVLMFNMIISPGSFLSLSEFLFSELLGG